MAMLFLKPKIFVLVSSKTTKIGNTSTKGSTMRRVVITGIGITSSIGNNADEVKDSLKVGRSGIVFAPDYAELGFRSQIHGTVKLDVADHIDRKQLRFMGEGAAYAVIAMEQAIADSGLSKGDISNPRTGLIAGSGGPSTANMLTAFDTTRDKGPKRVGPYMVPRCMSSTISACIATFFEIKGLNYSITSACSTSSHCISTGVDAIRHGQQDIVFAGGGEELHWTLSVLFDAMGAMSSKYNDTPEKASRPYDSGRDGFVIAGGGGMVVLEDYDHAKTRGAKIYAEVAGYGANSDGHDMVAPSGEGAVRCMELALLGFDGKGLGGDVDYINAHGTSTPVGDIRELEAIRSVFDKRSSLPVVTSTKSLTGHSLGATGVQEAIYTMLMMQDSFVAGSANIETPDPGIGTLHIPTVMVEKNIDLALSNSFGFGGTNATLALRKVS
jgi:3-oxoacyl-[acyl-carrier-protein] synthase-1